MSDDPEDNLRKTCAALLAQIIELKLCLAHEMAEAEYYADEPGPDRRPGVNEWAGRWSSRCRAAIMGLGCTCGSRGTGKSWQKYTDGSAVVCSVHAEDHIP